MSPTARREPSNASGASARREPSNASGASARREPSNASGASASAPDSARETTDAVHHKQVAALRNGTVVDHLNSGMALKALEVLGVPKHGAALLGIHLESRKMGRKDILKLENVELSAAEIARLAVFGPEATVSLIRDYVVVRKARVELPDTISGILRCPNPNCVTNFERIETRFEVEARTPIKVRCRYCERRILESEFALQ